MDSFQIESKINAPLDKVYHAFSDVSEIPKWKPYVTSCEILDISPANAISVRKINQDISGRKIYSVETVLVANEPVEYKSRFESNGGTVLQSSTFRAVSSTETIWTYESQFNQKWFVKVFTFFLRNLYKNSADREIEAFKQYVEEA